MRRSTSGERIEGDLSSGVLGLTESRVVMGTFERLAVKVNGSLEPGSVVWTFPNASVGRQVKAASLRQLLQLVLIHSSLISTNFSLYLCFGLGRRIREFEMGYGVVNGVDEEWEEVCMQEGKEMVRWVMMGSGKERKEGGAGGGEGWNGL